MPKKELSQGEKLHRSLLKRFGSEKALKEWRQSIGRSGGQKSKGGFSVETVGRDGLTGPERARIAGARGGKISKRGQA